MRRLLAFTSTAAVLTAGTLISGGASAAPLSGRLPIDDLNTVQDVAICFYLDGWNGPGLYECGYRYRRGYGWHGRREGYHGRDERREERRGDRREERRGDRRESPGRDPGYGR